MDNAARINMLARKAGMSYGQYQAMLFEQNGYQTVRIPEPEPQGKEPEQKPSEKFCVMCGKPLMGRVWGRTKTCGRECSYQLALQRARNGYRKKGPEEGYENKCQYCGKVFRTFRSRQRFCCGPCRGRYKAAVHRGIESPTAERNGMADRTYGTGKCEVCGTEFIKRAPNKKYCCEKCAAGSRSLRKDE